MKRNPIIKKYVSKIRRRLKCKRWYLKNKNKKKLYDRKRSNKKKKRNPIIKKYVYKIRKRLANRRSCIKNKKNRCLYKWVRRGLITDNIDEVYKRYEETTNCDLCNVLLKGIGSTKKCMDHSHSTGKFRNILCLSCNIKRGEDN